MGDMSMVPDRLLWRRARVQCVPALLLAVSVSPAFAQGVHVALMPAQQTVAPGAEFVLELDVTEPGLPFNGYDAVIEYDPSALTFLPASPLSLQEGSYMKGACGSTFHYFMYGGDSLLISHALLCPGMVLTGPGQLYRLRFRASMTPQATWIRIRHVRFYDAGTEVGPLFHADAVVGIGVTLGAPLPGTPRGISLRVAPNPCRAAASILVECDVAGEQRLQVFDVAGRSVRLLERGAFNPGRRSLVWDGRDDRGARVRAGIYHVVLSAEGRVVTARLVLVP
jgi:hypothetical protein